MVTLLRNRVFIYLCWKFILCQWTVRHTLFSLKNKWTVCKKNVKNFFSRCDYWELGRLPESHLSEKRSPKLTEFRFFFSKAQWFLETVYWPSFLICLLDYWITGLLDCWETKQAWISLWWSLFWYIRHFANSSDAVIAVQWRRQDFLSGGWGLGGAWPLRTGAENVPKTKQHRSFIEISGGA